MKETLVAEGLRLVEEEGARGLGLKELAARCGVSVPALYHHFRNKEELLAELALRSLSRFEAAIAPALRTSEEGLSLAGFARAYVGFATEHPHLYDLVFGRTTWGTRGGEVQARARKSFRSFVRRIEREKERGRLAAAEDPLRIAQVAWATLHGLCRMHDDGLAFSREAVIDVASYAAGLLARVTGTPPPKREGAPRPRRGTPR